MWPFKKKKLVKQYEKQIVDVGSATVYYTMRNGEIIIENILGIPHLFAKYKVNLLLNLFNSTTYTRAVSDNGGLDNILVNMPQKITVVYHENLVEIVNQVFDAYE